jgi:hypothetical protein
VTEEIDQSHVAWARNHFRMLVDGGTWALPSTGLIFSKRNGRLELIAKMPHSSAMPITKDELKEQQKRLFNETKRHFEAAGISVVDMTKEE